MMPIGRVGAAVVLTLCLFTGIAAASDLEFGVYGGWNGSHSSSVQAAGTSYPSVDWDGKSFEDPPYYGVRATYWTDLYPGWGVMLDFTHAKVAADPLPTGVSLLEFTDGLNLLTLNAVHRWNMDRFRPYVGVGAGINVPHVEFQTTGGPRTFRYDFGGATLQAEAGVEARLTDRFSLFGAYKVNYSWIDVDLVGGGSLDTEILTHQALVGISFRLDAP